MAELEIKQVIMIEGVDQTFESKAAALDYLRRPKIMAALMVITDQNQELSDWLVENQETVTGAFDTGTIRRVTKSEKKKLEKAMAAIVENNDKAFGFVVENADAIMETFRWPKVKRMTPEEKSLVARNTLLEASDNNSDLANWTIENEAKILEAYDAGKEKRAVSPQAANGLAAYRAGKTEEKRLIDEEGMDPVLAEAAGKELTKEIRVANGMEAVPAAA